jgi:hypothetical protein
MADRVYELRLLMHRKQEAPVPMPIAASLAHFQLSRQGAEKTGLELECALNDAAAALSQLADVSFQTEVGETLRMPPEDVQGGRFERGGSVFRAPNGQLYRALSIRRADLMAALVVLERARRTSAAGEEARRSGET